MGRIALIAGLSAVATLGPLVAQEDEEFLDAVAAVLALDEMPPLVSDPPEAPANAITEYVEGDLTNARAQLQKTADEYGRKRQSADAKERE